VENLRDIKGILSISDYSLLVFITIVLIFLIILWSFLKFIKFKKRTLTKEEIAKMELRKLNFENSKECSYVVSKYLPVLLKNEDLTFLNRYKYKKNVENFSDEDLKKLKFFLEKIDV